MYNEMMIVLTARLLLNVKEVNLWLHFFTSCSSSTQTVPKNTRTIKHQCQQWSIVNQIINLTSSIIILMPNLLAMSRTVALLPHTGVAVALGDQRCSGYPVHGRDSILGMCPFRQAGIHLSGKGNQWPHSSAWLAGIHPCVRVTQ
jgi:hypothetical protein